MPHFTWSHSLPQSPETVYAWMSRPGAFTRLVPDFMGTPVQEPTHGLRTGSESRLALSPSFLPFGGGLPWTARHVQYSFAPSGQGTFTDVQESGPFASWEHRHRIEADGHGGTRVLDDVTYTLPLGAERIPGVQSLVEASLRRTFEFRSRRLTEDLAFHERHPERKTFLLTGSSGLVGTQLTAFLRSGGHRVITLHRRDGESEQISEDAWSWDPSVGMLHTEVFGPVDAVVHLAGAPLLGRFTEKHKEEVRSSRVESTRTLTSALSRHRGRNRSNPEVLVTASASGYYGAAAGLAHEEAPAGDDFLASVCEQWEAEARKAEFVGIRTVQVRTGIVLNARGGMLALQTPQFAAGAGGPIGDGSMRLPWVSLDDLVRVYAFSALDRGAKGPINAAGPEQVTQKDYARTLGSVLRRPAVIPTPKAAMAAVLGREGAEQTVLADTGLETDKLRGLGFEFTSPTLEDALRRTLGR